MQRKTTHPRPWFSSRSLVATLGVTHKYGPLPITYGLSPVAYPLLPIACCLSPIASRLLPIAYCLSHIPLAVAHRLSPIVFLFVPWLVYMPSHVLMPYLLAYFMKDVILYIEYPIIYVNLFVLLNGETLLPKCVYRPWDRFGLGEKLKIVQHNRILVLGLFSLFL